MEKSFFKEEQKFTNIWIWAILIVAITVSLAPTVVEIYKAIVLQKPSGENPDSMVSLTIILFVLILVYFFMILLFKKMRLATEIRADGLFFRFPPFLLKEKKIAKQEIRQFEIRKYRPIMDYGGWGIRHGWGKAGRAYNVKGNTGLQLYLQNGKKVLIGTQRPEAIFRAMNKMMKEE